MIHKIKYSKLRLVIREALLLEKDDDDKEKGPVDKMKGWEPPAHMVHGSSSTSWNQFDDWDTDDGAFDMGLDEADGEDVDESHHEEDD
tara:strand:+ start:256 stop:519 length:264 start_codon:yes stop_codon:yes gene_type:complete